jgi:IrrE N-terminal-like domain
MPRTETWSEPVVLKLIARHKGKAPEEILEQQAERLLREADQDTLPINVDLVASVLGIRRRLMPLPYAGRIFAEPSGQLVMDLNSNDASPRRRFTQAHEVIHTVFPGFTREARYRADETPGGNARNNEEEYLCDVGAAALLMPRHLVTSAYRIADGLPAVEALSGDADVSLEAAGNRLVSVSEEPAAFLVLTLTHKPADTPALRRGEPVEQRVRVRYGTTSGLDLYLPRYKSAPPGSGLCRAWESGRRVRAIEPLPGADSAGQFHVDAKVYGSGVQRRVLALARPA